MYVTLLLFCLRATTSMLAAGNEFDVEFRLVVLREPSASERTTTLPESVPSIEVGDPYYVELWVSDIGAERTGIVSAYVDLEWLPSPAATAQSVQPSSTYNIFATGYRESGKVDELGGSTLQGRRELPARGAIFPPIPPFPS